MENNKKIFIGATTDSILSTTPVPVNHTNLKYIISMNKKAMEEKYPKPPYGVEILEDTESVKYANERRLDGGFDLRYVKASYFKLFEITLRNSE